MRSCEMNDHGVRLGYIRDPCRGDETDLRKFVEV